MKDKIMELIKKENKRNPLTDEQLSHLVSSRREMITLVRNELKIPDSRERRKPVLIKTIKDIFMNNEKISERELTRKIKEQGFDVSRFTIRDCLKEIKADKYQNEILPSKTSNKDQVLEDKENKNNSFKHKGEWAFVNIIGSDGSLKPFIQLAKAAILYPPNGLHTLILGATGVGKSELALAMYEFAKEVNVIRKEAPFIVFNCADYADNPQLLMAQLFGYAKGTFTGADVDKEGLVEKANGSILFLDEVHRLPSEGQELLFYLIDKGKFRRLGERDGERVAQVTIIAATTENPDSVLLITFRRRIPMVIELPTLNMRPQKERFNIIKVFFRQEAYRTKSVIQISNEAVRSLLLYDCPGNIGQLRSDIQVSCARSFLNHVVSQTKMMKIGMEELPASSKKGLLKMQTNRPEIEKLTGNDDVIVHPDMKQDKMLQNEDIYTLPNEIYQYIEKRYLDLQNQDIDQDVINYIIGSEMEERLEKLVKRVEDNVRPLEKKDLIKIVGIEVIEVVEQIIRIAKWKLGITGDNLYYVLAVHLSTTIDRLKQGKMVKHPQLKKIKSEYKNEFVIAKEMVRIIEKELGVDLPEDEVGFITMYLRMVTKEKADEGRVGVIIISHGNIAKGMADVANRLLGVVHANAIEMSLDESPELALDRTMELVESIDEGKGVMLLVDMGSLVTFGELITKKTGIKTRSLTRTDTVMVIEAVRRSILPDADLDEIADTIEEKPKYISRVVNYREKVIDKPKVIVTICITGQGSAQKIKELLESITDKFDKTIDIIPIRALDANISNLILNIQKNKEIIAIVGTINPNIKAIPYISLEEIVKGNILEKFKNILKDDKEMILLEQQRNDQELRTEELLHAAITIMDMEAMSKEDALQQLGKLLYQNKYVQEDFIKGLIEREKIGASFLVDGVTIPHADPKYVIKPAIAFGKLKEELDWDGKRIRLVLLLALNENGIGVIRELVEFFESKDKLDLLLSCNKFSEIKKLFHIS